MDDILAIKEKFDFYVDLYNRNKFISNDPIGIPHRFQLKQDIEIAGFFAAIFAWGQRVTIISKANELMALMGDDPYHFIINHTDKDLMHLTTFVHRTFNSTDLLFFIKKLKDHYLLFDSLEDAFLLDQGDRFEMTTSLNNFYTYFTDDPLCLQRTKKHIANPQNGSTCKRLLMYLRWMVRKDDHNVDFGIWQRIPMSALMIPYDVHVDRIARQHSLITRTQKDWKTVVELSDICKLMDPIDPAKYDFALFGLSVNLEHK